MFVPAPDGPVVGGVTYTEPVVVEVAPDVAGGLLRPWANNEAAEQPQKSVRTEK
jgi:hypothetical protein